MTPNPDNDTVILYRDESGQWRWHRKDRNGDVVSESGEGYTNFGYAQRAAFAYNPGVKFAIDASNPGPPPEKKS